MTQARALFDDDPAFFRGLRAVVAPHLRTWAHVNVWLAGAGTGELAYAIAIALREEGLAGRLQVHATDVEDTALAVARTATYDAATLLRATDCYRAGGGRASIVDYVEMRGSRFVVRDEVRRDVVFALHSPATDASFIEAQLVVCRGRIDRFRRTTLDGVPTAQTIAEHAAQQARAGGPSPLAHAWSVVHESLCRFGVLAVPLDQGQAGVRAGNPYAGRYEPIALDEVDGKARFFRRGDA